MKHLSIVLIFLSALQAGFLRAGNILEADTLWATALVCDQPAGVCLGLPLSSIGGLSLELDGQPYSAGFAGCDFDTLITYTYNTLLGQGQLGPYRLDAWEVDGAIFSGQFNTIDQLVSMMNTWDPDGKWTHQPGALLISGGAPGRTYGDMAVTNLLNNSASIIGLNFGLDPQGTEIAVEQGVHQLILSENATNTRDTVVIVVECFTPPPPMYFTDTISADQLPHQFCLDTTRLPGRILDVNNLCPGNSGEHVLFTLDKGQMCVKYQGLSCNGQEQACFVACDDLGYCDTLFMTITVNPKLCQLASELVTDTLLINFQKTYCLDAGELPGSVVDLENLCPNSSGLHVDFDPDLQSYCVTAMGLAPGTDEACFVLRDQYGNGDTTFFRIHTRLPESGTIVDTIPMGQTQVYCLATNELAGSITAFTDACPGNGSAVAFTLNDFTLCVEAQGLAPGTESACVLLCDDYGVCDTTFFHITVPDNGDPCALVPPPVAHDDNAVVAKNTPQNIDILSNDEADPCLPLAAELIEPAQGGIGPQHGVAILRTDQTVDFIPDVNYCGEDAFQYRLCNDKGCDTATVFVLVDCEPLDSNELIIYTGFSPNEDGFNDVFFIKGIENFPGNRLQVFNRWGSRVFQSDGYRNTWTGTYRGADLPDGTYFYLLELEDGRTFSGFVELRR